MIRYPSEIEKLYLGIASVSDGANDKLDVLTNYLTENRIKYEQSSFIKKSKNQVSESGLKRANGFMQMWNDNKINYVLSSFGGEFCMEVLEYIYANKKLFEENSKWFQGFSDASFISYFLSTNYNLATIHYYNAEDYGSELNLKKLQYLLSTISKLKQGYSFCQFGFEQHVGEYTRNIYDSNLQLYNSNPTLMFDDNVSFSGRLIGGWIEALSTICGTKYDNTKNFCQQFEEGVIWYIDNCELSSPMFRRKLWQLKEAGYFENCNGVLIGREPDDDFTGDYNYNKAITDTFSKLKIPVIIDADVGHFFPQWLLINGSYANIEYKNGKVKILQKLK